MFSRFRSFQESDPFLSRRKLEMDNVTLSFWLHDLASYNVGRYTLTAAVGSWNFMAAILDYPIEQPSLILKRYAESYVTNKQVEISRAKPYSRKLLCWLEQMALGNLTSNPVDQLVCGRMRLIAQASVRGDDCRRTPVGRMHWLLNRDGSLRAALTKAAETNVSPALGGLLLWRLGGRGRMARGNHPPLESSTWPELRFRRPHWQKVVARSFRLGPWTSRRVRGHQPHPLPDADSLSLCTTGRPHLLRGLRSG